MQIWDLLEGKLLFKTRLRDPTVSRATHFARMISLLGPPPEDLLERGSAWKTLFDEDGMFETQSIADILSDIVLRATHTRR